MKRVKNIEKNRVIFLITSAKNDSEGFPNFANKLVEQYLEKNKFNEWENISMDNDVKISIDKNVLI